ncbi:MAG: D-alanyl-D-alanine carboxypeptidase/D-alanyl-D-alanine-endopeptidase [Prevotella sp.]|nr:D-alanyl-D-alanine carboxypeptidase/D-alanyl-D-alanine-endopeptidase [Prevotella sp.]
MEMFRYQGKLKIITLALALLSLTIQSRGQDIIVIEDSVSYVAQDTLPSPKAESLSWQEKIRKKIDDLLLNDLFQTSSIGIDIYDLTDNQVLYHHNERLLLRPASTMKMITAVTALDKLGTSYKYSTVTSYIGNIEGGTLYGDIYCKGGFDPMLELSDLNLITREIKALGIDTIRGNVYADVSMKDGKLLGEGWCWDDDNPVLSPLVVSRKNDFSDKFKNRLLNSDIYYDDQVKIGTTPSGAKLIVTTSRTIGDVLPRMMKKSDNLYAESMFYQLSSSRPSTAKLCRQTVNSLISKMGLDPNNYYIADGSGLSLYNYVSAELEVEFLKYAYRNKDIFQPLYAAMPIAGVDGTLEGRMKSGYALNNVHAKTGTVTKISALTGYLRAYNGHIICFAIINNGVEKASLGRAFQDAVCQALCSP